jgi:hypothetical protein
MTRIVTTQYCYKPPPRKQRLRVGRFTTNGLRISKRPS